ncbi:MAG: hypothetical protein Q7S21_05385 [archaeon]|nr:hypothetical protein [archaeon]
MCKYSSSIAIDMYGKSISDLQNSIHNFKRFRAFLLEFKEIIDTGKLAEFYCCKLFDLKPVKPHNAYIDAKSKSGERIEIKHRFFSGKTPPGMKINLKNIDFVYYVELSDNLLPKQIFKIKKEDIEQVSKGRVSFKKVFKEKKAEIVFNQLSE